MKANNSSLIAGPQPQVEPSIDKPFVPRDDGISLFSEEAENNTSSTPNIQSIKIYESMKKSIHSWGVWLIVWTVFSVFSSNLSWAFVLAAIAAMSFYFIDCAVMFLVYTALLLWAGITNLISGNPLWLTFGAIQLACAVFTFKEYRKYRDVKGSMDRFSLPLDSPSISWSNRESRMAWWSFIFGVIGLIGLLYLIPAGFFLSYIGKSEVEQVVYMVFLVIFELGVLGLPVGIAALLTNQCLKAVAITGIVLGIFSALILIIGIWLAGIG
jgi:hypothetical protein